MAGREAFLRAVDQFSDWRWRLNNLYWITDKQGHKVQFRMNSAQEALFDEMHYMNVILKARQRGFTTFIQLFMLDACVFNSNIRAGTIAHTLSDVQTIFRDKVRYPYDNLPDGIRAAVPPSGKDSANELLLANNSSLRVGTSLRSGTLQYLHISEYGKICAKYPDKAREVRTGALNTVQAGQIVFVESTAEGQEGHYYELCQDAQSKKRTGSSLTPLDFKFHFHPWWADDGYVLDPAGVPIPDSLTRYFDRLMDTAAIKVTPAQRAWYAKKAEVQRADMKREYPATPEEAFEAAVEGAYYGEQISKAEFDGRIGYHPALPDIPVNTAWDIGVGDSTDIWFFQDAGSNIRFIGFYSNSGEGAPHYAAEVKRRERELGWKRGDMMVPHDAKVKEWGSGRTRLECLVSAGFSPKLVPIAAIDDGINAVREIFPLCEFDEAGCADGLKALRAYRKVWNEERSMWMDRPFHNWASNGADAFRTFAMGYREGVPPEEPKDPIAELIRPKTLNELVAEHDGDTEDD